MTAVYAGKRTDSQALRAHIEAGGPPVRSGVERGFVTMKQRCGLGRMRTNGLGRNGLRRVERGAVENKQAHHKLPYFASPNSCAGAMDRPNSAR